MDRKTGAKITGDFLYFFVRESECKQWIKAQMHYVIAFTCAFMSVFFYFILLPVFIRVTFNIRSHKITTGYPLPKFKHFVDFLPLTTYST